jgi:hypothetical protein
MSLQGAKYILKVRKKSEYITTYVIAAETVAEALYRYTVDDGCVEIADTEVIEDEQEELSFKEIGKDEELMHLIKDIDVQKEVIELYKDRNPHGDEGDL